MSGRQGADSSGDDSRSGDKYAWTEPGVFEVSQGVHRMPLPLPMDGLRAVNVYLLETDSGLVLIDGGWAIPESRRLFDQGLRSLGYRPADITRFLVTHMHRDHYTQAYVVGREFGAHVSLGVGDKPTMDLMHDQALRDDPNIRRLRLAGAHELAEAWSRFVGPEADLSDYGYPDAWLERDHTIDLGGRRLSAVSTPGHTQGHFVFADLDTGVLFAGDHVLPAITPSIGFEPAYVQQPLRDFLDSLAKVRALPDLRVLPAHGAVADSSHARVEELVEHHEVRLRQCLSAVHGGAVTAWEVAGELPWTKRNKRRGDLGPFDAVMAAFETLAHLELLALRGDLSRRESDGVVVFGTAVTGPVRP